MADAKETCRTIIAAALNEFIKEKNPEAEAVAAESIVVQNAPNPEGVTDALPFPDFVSNFP